MIVGRYNLGVGNCDMKRQGGFTLIEVMIVVVIVAVLLTIALPAYQNSVIKGNRAAGRGILLDVASRQEQYFINNKVYADTLAKLGYGVDGSDQFYLDNQGEKSSASNAETVYIVSLSTVPAPYAITASVRGLQVKDTRCGNFTVTAAGAKTNSGSGSYAECW